MSLPKQVQRQAEEVERIQKELEAANNPAATEPTDPPPAEPPPNEPSNPPADANAGKQSEPAATEPKAAPAPDASKTTEETWQKKYLTLQGMFNAEVPRLNTQVKELTTQLQSALTKLDELSKAQTKPAAADDKKPLVTDKDVEAFGSDLIDLVKRQAAEVLEQQRASFESQLEAFKTENAELKKQLGGVAEKQGANDRARYFDQLKALVPDYEVINSDEGFLGWLSEVDPMSGVVRQEYLNNAFGQFDPVRTANLFNAWKQTAKKVEEPVPQAPNPELTRQVAPSASKANSSASTPSADQKIWSMNEIDSFYRAVGRGEYKGRNDEQKRIESEIDLAVSQGRIKP